MKKFCDEQNINISGKDGFCRQDQDESEVSDMNGSSARLDPERDRGHCYEFTKSRLSSSLAYR